MSKGLRKLIGTSALQNPALIVLYSVLPYYLNQVTILPFTGRASA
jgi:hypothetical protein